MGFLDSTDQYVSDFDDYSIVPWKFEDDFVKPWDAVADVCKFRKFVDAKSRAASRKRLSTIIYKNAALLGGSKKTSRDVLTVRFLEKWILMCDYLKAHHKDDAEGLEILGQRMTITMGCWQFLPETGINSVIHLAGLQSGDPDAIATLEVDKQRRQAKRRAIQALEQQWQEVIQRLGYKLQEAEKIEMLTPAVVKALATIEDEIDWLASDTQVSSR